MRYLLLIFLISAASCSQDKGCKNQFASNYDMDALVDCCCEYNVDAVIESLEGAHTVKEFCSGKSKEYTLEISRNPSDSEGILISNFNNAAETLSAVWNPEGEFTLQKNWLAGDCEVTVTGSLHRNNGKLYIIYAAIPPNSCSDYDAATCETRGL